MHHGHVIGEQLGPYRILREIGRGGMGSVWLGEHVELGQRVAIKVLLPQVALDADQVQRFFNEARAAASVKHPGIVQVLDFGRTPAGAAYLAMELLEGETLRARLRARGALGADDAAMIARQVATTLGAAHEAGVVHRDLKPDNIMLVPDPEVASGERPKVLDFGIAKLAEDRWDASVATRTGSLLGTPHYMSPEQCRGTGEIDARADVYALGCILFELVCGRPPFVSQGLGEIVGMHQFVPAPSPRSVRADVPEWLEVVILRALAKDPARRYASMDDLARALEGGGVPAARLARASEPPATEAAVALAETLATPGATALAAAEVVHATDGDADVAALTADAQRRAMVLAETIAQEHRAKGGTGRRLAVVAVAVVVLAGVLLFVRNAKEPAPRPEEVAIGGAAYKDRRGGEPVATPGDDPHVGPPGSGAGSSAGSGTVTEPMRPPLDAWTPPKPSRDAGAPIHSQGSFRDAGVPAPVDAEPPPAPPDAGVMIDDPEDPNDDPEVKRYLKLVEDAAALFRNGDLDGGWKTALQAYEIFPDDIGVLQQLVVMACNRHDGTSARKYYKKITSEERRTWLFGICRDEGVMVPEP